MSSIGVVVFRNSPLSKAQVLQESVNNSLNISNNGAENVRREIIIVRKKSKVQSPPTTVSVSSLVRAAEPVTSGVLAKKARVREIVTDDASRSPTPVAVARRNARERNRVRQVNDGFAALRRHIPEEVASAFETANSNRGPNKKLSKVETLRMAVEYIRNLESLLNIGHADKENSTHSGMESFPSPASSSPRDNSQERNYFSMNSPALEDDDMEEDEVDGAFQQMPLQQYVEMPSVETFQLVSTPHLYEEEEIGGHPLTPSSDLLAQDEVSPNLIESHFPFPNSAEQFTVIPEQNYCTEADIIVNDSDFEVKYAQSIHQQMQLLNGHNEMPLDAINPDLLIHGGYKFKEQNRNYMENVDYSDVELKKELPDIPMSSEDREQFEETLKWWQEKTRLNRPVLKNKDKL